MTQVLLLGLGAGATAALLFATIATGQNFALGLFYLTPLPVLLAGLIATHYAAALASVFAAVLLGAVLGGWFAVGFLVGVGGPAYVLTYLAMLARPTQNGSGEQLEWYPPGRLVIAAALLAALTTAATIPAFGLDLESYRAELRSAFERLLRAITRTPQGEPLALPGGRDPGRMLEVLVIVMPPMAAAFTMTTNLVNLWLAARIARLSGRLHRPWPDITTMTFPGSTPIVLAAAIGGSFLPGLIGLVATILSATMLLAFIALGFAVVHGVSRAISGRLLVLAAVWAIVLLLGWPLLLVAIIGLADAVVDFRARFAGRPPPSLPTQPPPGS